MNLWLLTNTPSPYQMEFLRALHASSRVRLAVRFMRGIHRGQAVLAHDEPEFPHRVMLGIGPAAWRDEVRLHPRALWEVLTGRYDMYVLSGHYSSITFVVCAALLSLRRRPWVMWLERPWPVDYRPPWATRASSRSAVAHGLRERLLRRLVRGSNGVLCIGSAAVDAYRAYARPGTHLHNVPYFCDMNRYRNIDRAQMDGVRKRHDISTRLVFLFSGAMTERKGADTLLDAFRRLAAERTDVSLLLLGDGPLRTQLESSVEPHLQPRVRFAGHVSQADLPACFRTADVFVFPSRHDGWGVVLNEACAAGLPVVATRQTGASADLIREGVNGFVLERDDVDGFYDRMRFFAEHNDALARFSEASLHIAEAHVLEQGVARFMQAIEECRGATGERVGGAGES